MRSIVRRDTGEQYQAYLRRLAAPSGIKTPTREALARFDRKRKKQTSNKEWTSPTDPDAKVAKMKDGRTHLGEISEELTSREQPARRRAMSLILLTDGRPDYTIPSCRARMAACVRSRTSSLVRMFVTWFLTVPSARLSAIGNLLVRCRRCPAAPESRARAATAAAPALRLSGRPIPSTARMRPRRAR